MKNAIEIENIKKFYGNHLVLDKVSLQVCKGEIFGILGVNGAGKTTMLECMEGFRTYEEGAIKVNGTIGIQLQSASLPPYIKPKEVLELFSKWKGVKIEDSLISDLGIDKLEHKRYCELSTGQMRRLHLALALLGHPDILFLDEPTAGLDVEGRISLHQQIRKLNEEGTTIVLASHDMSEVETLCDRIAILNHGHIAFSGTVDDLAETIGKRYTINILSASGEDVYMADNIGDSMLSILQDYSIQQKAVLDIKIDRGSLEHHFMQLSKEE